MFRRDVLTYGRHFGSGQSVYLTGEGKSPMSTLPVAINGTSVYFNSEAEVHFLLNLKLAGRGPKEIARQYAEEFPGIGKPDQATVWRFFHDKKDQLKPFLDQLKTGVPLANVRVRLALLSDTVYGLKREIDKRLPDIADDNLKGFASLVDKMVTALREMAVQCGDTLISQLPQGSGGDRPQVFQTVLVEKLVNQTLIVSDGEAEKQSGAKKAGGELLSAQPAVSDPGGPASPA